MSLSSEMKPVSLHVTEKTVRAYAQLTDDFNPIHLDPAFAAATPMGRPIAHGTLSLCLIWLFLQRNFGPARLAGADLNVRFVKPVFIDEEIMAGGQPDPMVPDHYEIWVRGTDGTDRITGRIAFDTGTPLP